MPRRDAVTKERIELLRISRRMKFGASTMGIDEARYASSRLPVVVSESLEYAPLEWNRSSISSRTTSGEEPLMITVPTSDAFVAEIVETYRAPSLLREMPVSVQVVEAKDMRLYGDVIVATETTCTARAWIEAIEVEGDKAVLHCRGGIPGIEGRRR